MAHPRLSEAELAHRASVVFRQHGFEGTSMNLLSEALGIEKASLYYRYPGGKDEIVLAAAASIGRWFEENIFAVLAGPGDPAARLRHAMRKLRDFYSDGETPCMLDTLSLPGRSEPLALALKSALEGLLSAFAAIAEESGMRREAASRRAEQALIQIEGSLVLARVLGKSLPFRRAVAGLPALLLNS